jgi:DNA-binding MarR family transcriptional regulator
VELGVTTDTATRLLRNCDATVSNCDSGGCGIYRIRSPCYVCSRSSYWGRGIDMKTDTALDRSPIHLLHRAYQAVDQFFDVGMKTNGLTARQLAVLVTVAQNEGLSQTDIVERTGIDRSTLADVVRRLKRKGLLQRRRTKEDARAYAVTLTEEGQRVLRTAEPLAKRVDQRVLDVLPASRREQFMSALASIVSTLERSSHLQGGGA